MSQIMVLLVLTDDGARFSGPILLTRSKEHYPRLLAIKTVGIGCCLRATSSITRCSKLKSSVTIEANSSVRVWSQGRSRDTTYSTEKTSQCFRSPGLGCQPAMTRFQKGPLYLHGEDDHWLVYQGARTNSAWHQPDVAPGAQISRVSWITGTMSSLR